MLYGVSLAYKESANCRLEANYAHQQELDMIPLMMQENYKPQGWRKSLHSYQGLAFASATSSAVRVTFATDMGSCCW